MNKIINTKKAIDVIIDKLNTSDGNIYLCDDNDNSKIYLEDGALQILKAYYLSKKV